MLILKFKRVKRGSLACILISRITNARHLSLSNGTHRVVCTCGSKGKHVKVGSLAQHSLAPRIMHSHCVPQHVEEGEWKIGPASRKVASAASAEIWVNMHNLSNPGGGWMRGGRGSPCYIGNLFGRLQKSLARGPQKASFSHNDWEGGT